MTVTKFLKTLEFGRKSVQSHTKPTDELGEEKKKPSQNPFPLASALSTGPAGDWTWRPAVAVGSAAEGEFLGPGRPRLKSRLTSFGWRFSTSLASILWLVEWGGTVSASAGKV